MSQNSEYAFSLLQTQSASLDSIRVRDSHVIISAGAVLHGLDKDGLLHLLVPLALGEDDPALDERSAGVQLRPLTLESQGKRVRYLDVACQLPHLNALFYNVADEMLEEIPLDLRGAVHACHAVLDRWRELLERRRSHLLGFEQLLGLLAELLVLEALATRDPLKALQVWKGPQGERFDFVGGSIAVEVKASSVREGRSAEVHGIRQLEPIPGGELFLIFMRFESRTEGGLTVPAVVDRLITYGVPRLRLLDALQALGFSLSERSAYEGIKFELLEHLTYVVDQNFPRIIPASFTTGSTPSGVSHLRYRIDLAGPLPAPLEPVVAAAALDRLLASS